MQYGPDFKSGCDENDWYAFDILDEALKKTGKSADFFEISNNRVIS